MKQGEMVIHKTYGTYQLINDDGDRYYVCRHILSGQECTADTIKEAKSCLEDLEVTHQEIQSMIRKLGVYGYKIYKEVA